MDTVQITNNLLNKKVENKPKRFDMAINFFCCLKNGSEYFLVTYYYNPAWNLYYPFYDDKNKVPVLTQSKSETYKELINETNNIININLEDKVILAYKRFEELIGCKCKVKLSKNKETFELKYSKTANLYTIYKFFNFIITEVEDLNILLNPKQLKCELFNINNLDETKIVSNAVMFCNQSLQELKKNAIIWKN